MRSATRAVMLEGFLTRLGFGVVTFALPLYALSLGLSLGEIGLVAGAKALVQPAIKPLVGAAVDRYGARRGYLAAVLLRFAASAVLLWAQSTVWLLAVRLLQGAASAARDPVSITVIANGERGRLARTFSAAIAARDLGNVSAGLVAGVMLAATWGSFTTLWLFVCLLALAPVVIVWRWVSDDPRAAATHAPVPAGPDRVLADASLRAIAALGLVAGTTAHMTHALFQVFASEVAGLGPGEIGLIYSLSVGSLLVLGPLAGWAGDRLGLGPLAGARGACNAVSSAVYLTFPAFAGVLAGRLIDDAGKAAFRPTWGALVAGAAARAGERRGRVAAALDASLSLGEALGPLIGGLLWDAWGVVAFFGVRALLGVSAELVLGRRLRAALGAEPAMMAPLEDIRGQPADNRLAATAREEAVSNPLEETKGQGDRGCLSDPRQKGARVRG